MRRGEAGIFTTETRRHGEQQDLLKRRGMKEAMRLPTLRKSGERVGHPPQKRRKGGPPALAGHPTLAVSEMLLQAANKLDETFDLIVG